jgi:hypothetical protein
MWGQLLARACRIASVQTEVFAATTAITPQTLASPRRHIWLALFRLGWHGPGVCFRRIAPFSGGLPLSVDGDPVPRGKGSAAEATMTTENPTPSRQRAP